MCGIAGIYNSNLEPSVQIDCNNHMMKYMFHRGPDDLGFESFQNCIIGQTRLSIIDTSQNARQPFTDKKKNISIAVNGEIYNYKSLRKELIGSGYKFQSNSDSEVILHGYIKWGTGLFEKLEGMFAIAIYDQLRDQLILSRDRLGIKPLYYSNKDGSIVFASEIGSILASKLIKPKLDISSLYSYLFLGYMPQGINPINEIETLAPGTYILFTKEEITTKKYWNLSFSEDSHFENEQDLLLETRRLLDSSIKSHTQSDVPLGVFLSGGIDSTIITGLVADQFSNVKTLSVGFEDGPSKLNELALAKQTSNYFGTDHSEFILNGSYVESRIEKIISHMDSPSFDGINTFIVSEMAKKSGLTVALSGLGGDELFGGYEIFNFYPKYMPLLPYWNKIPSSIKQTLINIASNIISNPDRKSKIRRLEDIKDASSLYALNRANSWPLDIYEILQDDHRNDFNSDNLFNIFNDNNSNSWKSLQEKEIKNYVSSRLLRDTDAMSMANSLEVRVPLLDDSLVNHMTSIESNWNNKYGWPKKLLIESTRDMIPEFVLNKKKQGFQLPMEVWMRNELEHIVEDAFSVNSINDRGLFNAKKMQGLLQKFKQGRTTYDQIWKFVSLELWLRNHNITI
jgi:asparagine synthase (glutamine-hydrolysing)